MLYNRKKLSGIDLFDSKEELKNPERDFFRFAV